MKKKNESLEERLLSPKEIDDKISELQRLKMLSKSISIKPKEIVKEKDFSKLSRDEVFDYHSFYEVSDVRNATAYYLNGAQVSSLFGMNEEYRKQFAEKYTNGQAQLDDKLVTFYYREMR